MIIYLWEENYGTLYNQIPLFYHKQNYNFFKLINGVGNIVYSYSNELDTFQKLYIYDFERSFGEYLYLDILNQHNDNLIIWKCIEQIDNRFVELTGIRFADIHCYYPLRVKIISNTASIDLYTKLPIQQSSIDIFNAFPSITNLRLLTRNYNPYDTIRDEPIVYNDVYIPERDICMLYLCHYYQQLFHKKLHSSLDIQTLNDLSFDEKKKQLYNLLINNLSYHINTRHLPQFGLVKNLDYGKEFITILHNIELYTLQPNEYFHDIADKCNNELTLFLSNSYFPETYHTTLTTIASNKNMFNMTNVIEQYTDTHLPIGIHTLHELDYIPGNYLCHNNICTSINDFNISQENFKNLYMLTVIDPIFKIVLDYLIRVTEKYGYFNIILDMTQFNQSPTHVPYSSYMYPIKHSIDHQNLLYKELLGLFLLPYNIDAQYDNNYIYSIYRLKSSMLDRIIYEYTHNQDSYHCPLYNILIEHLVEEYQDTFHPTIKYIQVTKTIMDDIVISFFLNHNQFIGGYYINEIIETLNTPVVIDTNSTNTGIEYLREYSIPISKF
jgi:hypothetical protein